MLEIKNVKKIHYNKSGAVRALNEVNLSLGPGEIVGLFGENGAGNRPFSSVSLGFIPARAKSFWMGKKSAGAILPVFPTPPVSILFSRI